MCQVKISNTTIFQKSLEQQKLCLFQANSPENNGEVTGLLFSDAALCLPNDLSLYIIISKVCLVCLPTSDCVLLGPCLDSVDCKKYVSYME